MRGAPLSAALRAWLRAYLEAKGCNSIKFAVLLDKVSVTGIHGSVALSSVTGIHGTHGSVVLGNRYSFMVLMVALSSVTGIHSMVLRTKFAVLLDKVWPSRKHCSSP
jgi:hypothetical protein